MEGNTLCRDYLLQLNLDYFMISLTYFNTFYCKSFAQTAPGYIIVSILSLIQTALQTERLMCEQDDL